MAALVNHSYVNLADDNIAGEQANNVTTIANHSYVNIHDVYVDASYICIFWRCTCETQIAQIKTMLLYLQEHRDLKARIAQIIKSTEETQYSPAVSAPKANKYSFQTRPYNDDDDEEPVMDDEELHSLLGV